MIPALIFALTFIAFLPALRAGFVWDDVANLFDNQGYRHFDRLHLKWMWTTTFMGPYQPFSWMSLGLDFHLWGMNAWGFHLTSLLLHCANAVLFFYVARELLSRALKETSGVELGAAAAALFFSVHPLRVESAVWVTERRDVLSGFFALAATYCYMGRRLRCAFALYAACLLSKATGAMLPAAWLIIDFYPARRTDAREAVLEKLPFFALSAAAAVMAVHGQASAGNMPGLEEIGLSARLARTVMSLAFYAWKTLRPAGLCALYRPPESLTFPVLISLGFLGTLAAALKLARVELRAQAALWSYYAISVLPISGLLQNGPQLAADRYSYLSCLGWALLAGAAAIKTRARAAAAVVLIALGALTWRQARFWRDDDALWSRALTLDPGSVPARLNYGLALAGKRRLFEALSVYEEAEAMAPGNAMLWDHHGYVLLELKRYAEAEACLRKALSLDDRLDSAWTYLGVSAMQQGRLTEAVADFGRAVELKPGSLLAQANLDSAREALADAEKKGKK